MSSAYAIPDDLAADRPHAEPASPILPGFALDRWRVFNCSAFRRLQSKTQVFVTDEGDHYRTRLTHTLEVSQVSRILAERLGLNPVLTEVIAIVHDLGHPPFGHAGEEALHELMAGCGGFDHNLQALRVIDLLEHPYRHFHGLNLANVVRWAHQLHSAQGAASQQATPADTGGMAPEVPPVPSLAKDDQPPVGRPAALADKLPVARGEEGKEPGALPVGWRQQPLEGQVTNLADRIAYDVHDIEDALGANLVSEADLQQVQLWRLAADPVRRQWPDLMLPAIRRHILDALAMYLVDDLVAQTQRNLQAWGSQGWEAFCKADRPCVAFSGQTEAMLREHEAFLAERAYRHPRVAAMDDNARSTIRTLFEAHVRQPQLLPARYFQRIERQGLRRVICDYIAGMTDRFCQDACRDLSGPFTQP